jgi:hypothetical protein
MSVDQKILEEIARYNSINKYIMEQVPPPPGDELGAPPPPGGEAPIGGEVPPPAAGAPAAGAPATPAPPTEGEPIDVEADADVEEIGADEEGGEEEIDITDLVDTQKTMSDKQEEYFNNLFTQLSNLESKLGEMDQLVQKINSLETKFDQFRPKTPEEKLELRSLDSGPFKQKLSDFFVDKQEEMRQSGKNEYVLTSDDVEEYSPEEVKTSFNDYEDEDENNMMR